jgi:hypothetical protein
VNQSLGPLLNGKFRFSLSRAHAQCSYRKRMIERSQLTREPSTTGAGASNAVVERHTVGARDAFSPAWKASQLFSSSIARKRFRRFKHVEGQQG